jgi:hypothetical protein
VQQPHALRHMHVRCLSAPARALQLHARPNTRHSASAPA